VLGILFGISDSGDTKGLEREPPNRRWTEIDQLVYKLYVLTPANRQGGEEEIAIVEDLTRRVEGKS